MDLGVSSMQIDRPERGFSYLREGPLDMRMDASSGQDAAGLLARIDEAALSALLWELGVVRRARGVARAILRARDSGRLAGTADLRRAVESVVKGADRIAELARVFQALRIAVNGELTALDAALAALPDCLAPAGRAVIISYHSLEDRRVKRFIQRESRDCLCPPGLPVCACAHRAAFEALTPRAVRPAEAELAANPRSRSARLRAIRRLDS